jgi:hypothetical protein
MRTAQRSVRNQQNIVLRIDVRIIVVFLVINPLGSHCCWSIKTSLAFPPRLCTYGAAPPRCSRKTYCRSDRVRQEFRPWCHLDGDLEKSIVPSRGSKPMVCIAGQQHRYPRTEALQANPPQLLRHGGDVTHEHLPESLLGADAPQVSDGTGGSRHGSAVAMRLSA